MTRAFWTAGLTAGLVLATAQSAGAQSPRAPAPATAAATADPLAGLATDVNAVLGAGAEAKLLLVETDHGVTATRTIGVGEEYRDGWKISSVAPTSVVLNKGQTTRTVALSGRTQSAAAPQPVATPGPANIAVTNAVVGGSGTPRPRTPEMDAAITKGDMAAVLKMGGTAQDVAAALRATGVQTALNMDPASATFVQVGDRYGIAFTGANGNRQVFVNSAFDGYVPSSPVRSVPAPTMAPGSSGTFLINGGAVTRTAITAPTTPGAPAPPAAPSR